MRDKSKWLTLICTRSGVLKVNGSQLSGNFLSSFFNSGLYVRWQLTTFASLTSSVSSFVNVEPTWLCVDSAKLENPAPTATRGKRSNRSHQPGSMQMSSLSSVIEFQARPYPTRETDSNLRLQSWNSWVTSCGWTRGKKCGEEDERKKKLKTFLFLFWPQPVSFQKFCFSLFFGHC